MKIQIKSINSKIIWTRFLDHLQPHTFLQSWEWGEFQERMGEKIWRLGIYQGRQLVGVCSIVKVTAKRGNFLLSPHGPIIKQTSGQIRMKAYLNLLVDYLKNLAKQEQVSFIRVCPLWPREDAYFQWLKELGFRAAPTHAHPELVWLLKLSLPIEQIYAEIRKTTRHSINKSVNDGVEIIKVNDLTGLEIFWPLYSETVRRQGFIPFNKNYLKTEFDVFSKTNKACWFFAKYQNDIIAGTLHIFSHGGVFYHQGASSLKYKQLNAMHLLQWHVIQEAKLRGCQFYNFWGIAPENKPNHPWQGLTLFKKGFGGFAEEYLPTQDLVVNHKYWLNYAIEIMRKWRRGY